MKKPPYIKFYVKDFVFDTVGMSDEELGAYMRQFIGCYKSGKIPKTKHDESLFKELKSCFQEYNDICERNRKNRLKSDANKNESSTSRQPVVNERSTTLVNQNQNQNQEPIKEKSNKKEISIAHEQKIDALSVNDVSDWLEKKRVAGKYLMIDEYELLEKFKDYCRSKNPKYTDYVAAFRNSFKWQNAPTKGEMNGKSIQAQRADEAVERAIRSIEAQHSNVSLIGSSEL